MRTIFFIITVLIYDTYTAGNLSNCINKNTEQIKTPENIQVATDMYISDLSCEKITCKQIRAQWSTEIDLNGLDCEHIIDQKNVINIADDCPRDIIANLIPADSKWNRALGRRCWTVVLQEKRAVYGDIFEIAMSAVQKCCAVPSPKSPDSSPTQIVVSTLLTLAIFAFITAVILYNRQKIIEQYRSCSGFNALPTET